MTRVVAANRRFSPALGVVVCLALILSSVGTARAALTTETLRQYILKVGAKIDSSKGNVFVTSMGVGNDKVELRLLNDTTKQRLGFYAFGFGSVAEAEDAAQLHEYLALANSEIGLGTFFVDKDRDIGFKFFAYTRDPLSYDTFAVIYMAMATVVKERRPVIHAMMKAQTEPKKDEEPPKEPPVTMEPPPTATPPGRR